jgi:hypothetical protein
LPDPDRSFGVSANLCSFESEVEKSTEKRSAWREMRTLIRATVMALLLTTVTACATTKNGASSAASAETGSPNTDLAAPHKAQTLQSP